MTDSRATIQKRYRQNKAKDGLVEVRVRVKKAHVERVRKFAKTLSDHAHQ